MMVTMTQELTDESVLQANADFYQALEDGDLARMVSLWSHDGDTVCSHPGRKPLRGWAAILQSWRLIFDAGGNPQIIVTDTHVTRRGEVAWVTVTENLLSEGHAGAATALNLFEYDGEGWKLLAHHAAPLLA
jgi:ketosteroid isomerase-like protein